MKGILNKKGVAIEMTLFALLEVFALCMLLTTVCLQMNKREKTEIADCSEYLTVAQIESDFLAGSLEETYQGMDYMVDNPETPTSITIKKKDGVVVSYLKVEIDENENVVIKKHLNYQPES